MAGQRLILPLFMGAVLIALGVGLAHQLHDALPATLQVSNEVAWAAEAGLYVIGVALASRSLRLSQMVMVFGLMVGLRLGMSWGVAQMHSGHPGGMELRGLLAVFALAAGLASKEVLLALDGVRPELVLRSAPAKSGGRSAPAPRLERVSFRFLTTAESGSATAVEMAPKPATTEPAPAAELVSPLIPPPLPEEYADRPIEIPAAALVNQLPPEWVNDPNETRRQTEVVRIPLAVLWPELREGQLRIPLSDLQPYLPNGLVSIPAVGRNGQAVTDLAVPLQVVVPQLPSELFALGRRAPLPWAKMEAETTAPLFAPTNGTVRAAPAAVPVRTQV